MPIDQVDHFGDPHRKILEARAKDGEGVVQTFFELMSKAWTNLNQELQLEKKLGIDAQAFRKSLADHVGVTETIA